nr:MAG TPA: Head Tail Connector Protein [Caudoviricetes sp.]
MNLYTTYAYYISTYRGNLTEEEFEKSIVQATAHVRRITFGQADENMDMDEVKFTTCAVCDVLANDEKARSGHLGRTVISESTDGYSVTYENRGDDLLTRKIYEAAETYLEPTGLLYLGVK